MKTIAQTLAAAAAFTAFTAAPALAEPDTFVFRVAEDQLASQADAERAYQRLTAEAARYCDALNISARSTLAECRLDVVAHVVDAVGEAELTAVHRERTRPRTLADAG